MPIHLIKEFKLILYFQLTALAQTEQDLLNGYAKPKPAGQGGMVGTMNPEEMPQAKFGGQGGHRVLTTGDHPIDDHKPDLGHHKPRPGMSIFFRKSYQNTFHFLFFRWFSLH